MAKKLQTKSSISEEDSLDQESVEYFMYLIDKTEREVEIRGDLVKILIYKDDDKVKILSTIKLFI